MIRQKFIERLHERRQRFAEDLEPSNIDKLNIYERGYTRGQLNLIDDIFEEMEETKLEEQSRQTTIKWPPDVQMVPCNEMAHITIGDEKIGVTYAC